MRAAHEVNEPSFAAMRVLPLGSTMLDVVYNHSAEGHETGIAVIGVCGVGYRMLDHVKKHSEINFQFSGGNLTVLLRALKKLTERK
jgi:hypothetical protein